MSVTNLSLSTIHALASATPRAEAPRPASEPSHLVAVLFLHLPDFAEATRGLGARDMIALTREYRSRFLPLLEDAGGMIETTSADGVLVSFGAGDCTGRESADALRALARVDEAARAWATARSGQGLATPQVAGAVAVGDVRRAVLGYGDRTVFSVEGEPMRLVREMATRARASQVRFIATELAVSRAGAQGWTGQSPSLFAATPTDATVRFPAQTLRLEPTPLAA